MIIKYSHRKSYILGRIELGKDKMLMTIVLSLLAVWLTILIGCQLIGIFLGYKFFKAVAEEKNDWKA